MLVKCGMDRLLLTKLKHCRWSAYGLVLVDAYTSWLDDTEASDAGASWMASTALAESSGKHNIRPSVKIQLPSWLEDQAPSTSSSQKGCFLRYMDWENVTMDTKLVEDNDKTGRGEVIRLGQQTSRLKQRQTSHMVLLAAESIYCSIVSMYHVWRAMERKALLTTQFCVVFKILICLPTSNLFNNSYFYLWSSLSHFAVFNNALVIQLVSRSFLALALLSDKAKVRST